MMDVLALYRLQTILLAECKLLPGGCVAIK